MSEVLNWNNANNAQEYAHQIDLAHRIATQDLILPGGDFDAERILTAYTVMGGNHNIALVRGAAGGGKTAGALRRVGSKGLVSTQSMDTEASLYGHTNPINAKEIIDGKMNDGLAEGGVILDEVTNLPNPEAILALRNDRELHLGSRAVDLAGVTVIMTSNFPKRGSIRVNETIADEALGSGIGMEVIPMITPEIASLIQNPSRASMRGKKTFRGILPTPATKIGLREMAYEAAPIGSDRELGRFVVQVISRLSDLKSNGKFVYQEVPISDGRIGEAFYNVAIAARLADGKPHGSGLNPEMSSDEYARIASLVMSHRLNLAEGLPDTAIQANVGRNGNATPEEVARFNKIVATAVAFKTRADIARSKDSGHKMPSDTELATYIDTFSGVNDGSRAYLKARQLAIELTKEQ